jgi:hypothetical protein
MAFMSLAGAEPAVMNLSIVYIGPVPTKSGTKNPFREIKEILRPSPTHRGRGSG